MNKATLSLVAAVAAVLSNNASAEEAKFGNWIYSKSVDPITDKANVGASLVIPNGNLSLLCSNENKKPYIAVVLSADIFLGTEHTNKPIDYRFDSDKPVESWWTYSGKSVYLLNRKEAGKFINRIASARKIAFKVTTYNNDVFTSVIDNTEGVSDVLSALNRDCV